MHVSRRSLLGGVAAISLLCAVSELSAFTHGTAFNGGRSQINLNFVYAGDFPFINVVKTGGDWNYASAPNLNGQVSPALRDINGYPTSIQSGGYYASAGIPSQTDRPGNYVCRWVGGDGTTVIRLPGTLVLGTNTGASGRFVFSVTTGTSLTYGVVTTGGGGAYVRDFAIMHIDDETDWLAGRIFGRQFMTVLRQAKFSDIRFLNWQEGNGDCTTTWASRKPTGYFQWGGYKWDPALWASAGTTNSGNDYSLTFGSGAPVDKQTIHLQFSADSTVTSTAGITVTDSSITGLPASVTWPAHGFSVGQLIGISGNSFNSGGPPAPMSTGRNYYVSNVIDVNHFNISLTSGGGSLSTTSSMTGTLQMCVPATLELNGTGKVPIKNQVGDAASSDPLLGDGKPLSAIGGVAVFGTVTYDADLNCWLLNGATASVFSRGIMNGVPPEICLQLALELGADPWFVAPYLAVDPMTDWHTELAKYCRYKQPSWMFPGFEGVNEQWNFANGFYGTRYGWAKANAHWGTTFDQHNWQGKTVSTIGQAVNAAYGGPVGAGYRVINGAQTAGFTSTAAANTNDPRMTSTKYVAQTPVQAGYTKTAAYLWTTDGCIANYFSPAAVGTATEVTMAANYAAAAGNAVLQAQIATAYVDTLAGAASGYNLAQQRVYLGFAVAWVQKYTNSAGNVIRLCFYEGGYSPDLSDLVSTNINILRLASKFVPDVGKAINGGTFDSGDVIAGNYNDCISAGGVRPSCFNLAGGSGATYINPIQSNIWSVLDPNVQVTPQPGQWLAIVAFNH